MRGKQTAESILARNGGAYGLKIASPLPLEVSDAVALERWLQGVATYTLDHLCSGLEGTSLADPRVRRLTNMLYLAGNAVVCAAGSALELPSAATLARTALEQIPLYLTDPGTGPSGRELSGTDFGDLKALAELRGETEGSTTYKQLRSNNPGFPKVFAGHVRGIMPGAPEPESDDDGQGWKPWLSITHLDTGMSFSASRTYEFLSQVSHGSGFVFLMYWSDAGYQMSVWQHTLLAATTCFQSLSVDPVIGNEIPGLPRELERFSFIPSAVLQLNSLRAAD